MLAVPPKVCARAGAASCGPGNARPVCAAAHRRCLRRWDQTKRARVSAHAPALFFFVGLWPSSQAIIHLPHYIKKKYSAQAFLSRPLSQHALSDFIFQSAIHAKPFANIWQSDIMKTSWRAGALFSLICQKCFPNLVNHETKSSNARHILCMDTIPCPPPRLRGLNTPFPRPNTFLKRRDES